MDTNPQSFPFGQKGVIVSSEYAGWTVEVVDDTEETGGYYILIKDPNSESVGSIGFDWWLEHAENIPGFIEDMEWQIEWPATDATIV